jgi:Na+-translocating ferredoxin:NAD+ oxidoreductase RnfG subunit
VTGATVTRNAIISGVNIALTYYSEHIAYNPITANIEIFFNSTNYISHDFDSTNIMNIYDVLDVNNVLIGYVFLLEAPNSYRGGLELMVAMDLNGKIIGIEYIEFKETANRTQGIILQSFKDQFKNIDSLINVASTDDIDDVTGATVTRNAIITAVNTTLTYYADELTEYPIQFIINNLYGASQFSPLAFVSDDITDLYKVTDANNIIIGYTFVLMAPDSYRGNLEILVAMDSNGKIVGIEYVTFGETASRTRAIVLQSFKDQFKNIDSIIDASSNDDIDDMSGATVTRDSIITAVNTTLTYYQANLTEYHIQENVELFFGSTNFTAMTIDSEDLTNLYEVLDASDVLIGYAFILMAPDSYRGNLELLVAMDLNGKIVGIEYITFGETASRTRDIVLQSFKDQFKNIDSIIDVASNDDIDDMSGATVTRDSIITAVNTTITYFQENLTE